MCCSQWRVCHSWGLASFHLFLFLFPLKGTFWQCHWGGKDWMIGAQCGAPKCHSKQVTVFSLAYRQQWQYSWSICCCNASCLWNKNSSCFVAAHFVFCEKGLHVVLPPAAQLHWTNFVFIVTSFRCHLSEQFIAFTSPFCEVASYQGSTNMHRALHNLGIVTFSKKVQKRFFFGGPLQIQTTKPLKKEPNFFSIFAWAFQMRVTNKFLHQIAWCAATRA